MRGRYVNREQGEALPSLRQTIYPEQGKGATVFLGTAGAVPLFPRRGLLSGAYLARINRRRFLTCNISEE